MHVRGLGFVGDNRSRWQRDGGRAARRNPPRRQKQRVITWYQLGEDQKLHPVASEQPVIRRIERLRAEGATLQRIVDQLNADEVPTRSGKRWNAQTVNAILRREKKREH
jgi:hypothetical protein